MARARKSSSAPKKAAAQSARRRIRPLRWLLKWVLRAVMLVAALTVLQFRFLERRVHYG